MIEVLRATTWLLGIITFWTSGLVGSAAAQQWAEKMFNKLEHDFGTVARGADTVYRFEITNLYKQDMNIVGVRSSCGCTSPTVENPIFKTYEKAYIVAKFNTRTHVGRKGATLTVSFGPPYAAEVQIRVHGNIRSDVVFNPGAVNFGDTDQGTPTEQRVTVNYAGHSSWEIVDVTNDNDHFEVELNPMQREGGRVSYSLLVRLKDSVPTGYIKDQLTVVTNDPQSDSQRIPLYVTANVRPEFSVTPANLVLDDMAPGEQITKRIVVRSKNPFRIVDVDCGSDCFDFKVDEQAKLIHFVEVTFRAGEAAGEIRTPVRILTDKGENRTASFVVQANVAPKPLPPQAPATTSETPNTAAETPPAPRTASTRSP
jgi:hypothetical protein